MGGEQMGSSLLRASGMPKRTGKWKKGWWETAATCRAMTAGVAGTRLASNVAATSQRGRGLMSNQGSIETD